MKQTSLLHYIVYSLRLLWNVSHWVITILFGLNLITSMTPLMVTLITKTIIDELQMKTRYYIINNFNINMYQIKRFSELVIVLISVMLISLIISMFQNLFQEIISKRLAFKLNKQVLDKASMFNLIFFETPQFYDQLTRAQGEANSRPFSIVSGLFTLFNGILTILSLLLLLFTFNPLVTFTLLLLAIPLLAEQVFFSRKSYELNKGQTSGQREMFYFSYLLTNNQTIKEIKLFGLSAYIFDIYTRVFNKHVRESIQLNAKRLIGNTAITAFGLVWYGGALFYMIVQTTQGIISIGAFVAYMSALLQLQSLISGLVSNFSTLYENALFLDNLLAFLALKPSAESLPRAMSTKTVQATDGTQFGSGILSTDACEQNPGLEPNSSSTESISDKPLKNLLVTLPLKQGYLLTNVGFSYPNSDKPALKNINLEIKPGETLALVGENGAGKSTLVKLLCRLYEPTTGKIHFNGNELSSYDLDSFRQQIGAIFQDYTKYWLTARENIGFGHLGKLNNSFEIQQAASNAGVNEIIERLSEGYETRLGVMWERSNQLSEGQWQRIALARAYVRDAAVLILDEPTDCTGCESGT